MSPSEAPRRPRNASPYGPLPAALLIPGACKVLQELRISASLCVGVDPTGAKTAKLALENWSYHAVGSPGPTDYAINYRLNGHNWHARKLDASELKMMVAIDNAGTRSLMLDVDPAELVTGTNKLELTTSNAQQATPVALNIDLILGMR